MILAPALGILFGTLWACCCGGFRLAPARGEPRVSHLAVLALLDELQQYERRQKTMGIIAPRMSCRPPSWARHTNGSAP
jgi:hypothetical protein